MPRGRKPKSFAQEAKQGKSPRIRPISAPTTFEQSERKLDWAQSYTSLLLGIVVVIIGVLFVISLTRNRTAQEVTSTATSPTITMSQSHTVSNGETLWSIAEKYYDDGFQWKTIAQANNLGDTSSLEAGQTLVIPLKEAASLGELVFTPAPSPTQSPTGMPTSTPAPSSEGTNVEKYTVQRGDTLWTIAERVYKDGYRWVDIARANNLAHPDVIHAGNELTLPR